MRPHPPIRRLIANRDLSLRAIIGATRPLHYRAPVGERSDLPAHVRAASAIRRHGSRLIVLQDDVNALAVLDTEGGAEPLPLPAGPGGARIFGDERGNKRFKMDLEACVALPDGKLLAFGSGSSAQRERIVVVDSDAGVRVLHARGIYDALRRCTAGMGVELNIEGAVASGDRLRLLQRGNDARARGGGCGNAVIDLPLDDFARWVAGEGRAPEVMGIIVVDLGAIAGIPFGFTDAATVADGRMAFLACAEDSADVRSDGPVLGCRFGWLDDEGACVTEILDADGRPTTLKLEGIESRAEREQPDREHVFDVVADMDHPDKPAVIAELRVGG